MSKFVITLSSGDVFDVEAPENISDDDLIKAANEQLNAGESIVSIEEDGYSSNESKQLVPEGIKAKGESKYPKIEFPEFDISDPLLYAVQREAEAILPRTVKRYEETGEISPWQYTQDAFSIPGRTLMGVASAYAKEGPEYGDRFIKSLGRTEADFSKGNMVPNFAESIIRDPSTPISLGAGRLFGMAASKLPKVLEILKHPGWARGIENMTRNANIAREATQIAGESAINAFSNPEGEFSPAGAVLGAVGATPGAAKVIKDAPAWSRVTSPSGVVEDLRNIMKPSYTMRAANKDALGADRLEEVIFSPSEYGGPLIEDIKDWNSLQDRIQTRLHDIAKKETDALSGKEFSKAVPADDVIAQAIKARKRIPAKYGQTDREALANELRSPFYDVYSEVVDKTELGKKGDKDAVNKLFDDMFEGGQLEGDYGTVLLSDVVSARKKLINAAKNRGKFSRADKSLSDAADAYTLSYQQLGDYIKSNIPEGPNATSYQKTQRDYAKLLPWRDALDQRITGALGTKQRRDQTELGRLGLLGESLGLFKEMPEKVDIDNAWELYKRYGKEFGKRENIKEKGSVGTKTGDASRIASQIVRLYKSLGLGNKDYLSHPSNAGDMSDENSATDSLNTNGIIPSPRSIRTR